MKHPRKISSSKLHNTKAPDEQIVPTVHDVVSHTKIQKNTGEKTDHVKNTLKESIVDDIKNIKGVKNTTLVNSMGDITASSIVDIEFNEFISFFSGIAKAFENTANLGGLKNITLKGSREDNLTIYLEDNQILCVASSRKISVRLLNQQINNTLQRSNK